MKLTRSRHSTSTEDGEQVDIVFKVALTTKKGLGTTTMQKFRTSEKLVRKYLS